MTNQCHICSLHLLAAGLLVAIGLAGSPGSAAGSVLHQYTYDVTGYIDTYDYLIIQNSTLQWHHTDTGGAAVGRHAGNNFPTTISSTIDGLPALTGASWTPTWPDPVPNEIRFDAYSSVYDDLVPPVPATGPLSVDVSVISGRGSVLIDQLPDAANDNTSIVEFKDGFDGSANLDALITITQVPEPGSLATLSIGACTLLGRRRQR